MKRQVSIKTNEPVPEGKLFISLITEDDNSIEMTSHIINKNEITIKSDGTGFLVIPINQFEWE